jgi:hypothetical protein
MGDRDANDTREDCECYNADGPMANLEKDSDDIKAAHRHTRLN